MTRAGLLRRVEHWRALLVPEWRLTVDDVGPQPADQEHHYNAFVQAADDYLHARLWIRADHYRDAHPAEVDVTLVHELLHLVLRELRRTLDLADGLMHRDARDVLVDRHVSEEERAVERLARVIVSAHAEPGLLYGTDQA